MDLSPGTDFSRILNDVKEHFRDFPVDLRDGMRIDTTTGWVQIRKSNTEPIIRIYAEERSVEAAEKLAETVIEIVKKSK